MKKILIEILIPNFTFQINSSEDQNLDCNHSTMLRVMDRELATKVSRKDGRKSYLAIAWELEVATIIDTRGAREPLLDGLWIFFSCIAERVRDIVGQQLEIRKRCETLIDSRIITGHTKTKEANKQTPKHKTTNTASNNSQNEKVKQIAPLSAPHSISSTM